MALLVKTLLMCYYAPMHQGRPVQKGLPTHYVWQHLSGTSALKTALSRPPPSSLSSNVSGNWSRFNNKLTALWTVLWGEEIASLSAAKEGGLRQKLKSSSTSICDLETKYSMCKKNSKVTDGGLTHLFNFNLVLLGTKNLNLSWKPIEIFEDALDMVPQES